MTEQAGDGFVTYLLENPINDGPSEDEERDFWNGTGHLYFGVTANRNGKDDVFEIDIYEYSGCVGGFGEGVGIEWGLKEGYLGIDRHELKEGYTYLLDEVTVSWFKGDGWTTDDDSEYYVGDFQETRLPLKKYLKLLIQNAWWFNIGYRISNWRNQRANR